MLTHEKVLKVFGPYLDADPDYEVVKTSRGYTVLAWNNRREEWFCAKFCKTPEDLRDVLLDAYVNYLECQRQPCSERISGNGKQE